MARGRVPTIVVVSDGRGETATRVVQAAAVQFHGRRYRVVTRGDVRTPRQVESAVAAAAKAHGAVFYTLVEKETRRALRVAAVRRRVPAVDVLGPAFSALDDLFRAQRGATPGLLFAAERERVARAAAIEFTLKHDDGQRPQDLAAADVVIAGVSRTSKSSTCFVLAYRGIRAANVPLVPGLPPPPQLLKLPPEKVVGIRMNVGRLVAVRQGRAQLAGSGAADYLDPRAVAREVADADRLMERRGWPVVDASYLAIEEIAREVMILRGLREHPW